MLINIIYCKLSFLCSFFGFIISYSWKRHTDILLLEQSVEILIRLLRPQVYSEKFLSDFKLIVCFLKLINLINCFIYDLSK